MKDHKEYSPIGVIVEHHPVQEENLNLFQPKGEKEERRSPPEVAKIDSDEDDLTLSFYLE